jgi:hypothetical protein
VNSLSLNDGQYQYSDLINYIESKTYGKTTAEQDLQIAQNSRNIRQMDYYSNALDNAIKNGEDLSEADYQTIASAIGWKSYEVRNDKEGALTAYNKQRDFTKNICY